MPLLPFSWSHWFVLGDNAGCCEITPAPLISRRRGGQRMGAWRRRATWENSHHALFGCIKNKCHGFCQTSTVHLQRLSCSLVCALICLGGPAHAVWFAFVPHHVSLYQLNSLLPQFSMPEARLVLSHAGLWLISPSMVVYFNLEWKISDSARLLRKIKL